MSVLCRNPFVKNGAAYGCGQCMPCRFNRRRLWAHRIMLEAAQYGDNAFVTLTYRPEENPGQLVPEHTRDWLKRLRIQWERKQIRLKREPVKLRYYLVGEYGDEHGGAHYHAAVFGLPTCMYGQSRYSKLRSRCCENCELVRETWGKGHIFCGTVEYDSAGYLAKYVTKSVEDRKREAGNRHPPFGRMSLRPGIGHAALWEVASQYLRYDMESVQDDVPNKLGHGLRKMPLGRYLMRSLRTMVGMDASAPQAVLDRIAEELRPMREAAFNASVSYKSVLVSSGDQAVRNMEARRRIFGGRK